MKILYGVQGTGNGHITRARGMSRELAAAGVEVDWLFSGRAADKYFGMEGFGNWRCLNGLTFVVQRGRIKPLATVREAKPAQLLRDIKSLSIQDYDLIISDFEPVSAWAAKRSSRPSLGIGHQYAFDYAIPKRGNPLSRLIMRAFAPTDYSLGMHWYHFQQPITPPIVEAIPEAVANDGKSILVYLPFEDPERITALLNGLSDYRFIYYGGKDEFSERENVSFYPPSRKTFQQHLAASGGVVTNAGFELASEAISLGKKILVKPLHGQMEQLSNALALQQLGLGQSCSRLDHGVLRHWLDTVEGQRIRYPDVARAISAWILQDRLWDKSELVGNLWEQTEATGLETFRPYQPPARAINGPALRMI